MRNEYHTSQLICVYYKDMKKTANRLFKYEKKFFKLFILFAA